MGSSIPPAVNGSIFEARRTVESVFLWILLLNSAFSFAVFFIVYGTLGSDVVRVSLECMQMLLLGSIAAWAFAVRSKLAVALFIVEVCTRLLISSGTIGPVKLLYFYQIYGWTLRILLLLALYKATIRELNGASSKALAVAFVASIISFIGGFIDNRQIVDWSNNLADIALIGTYISLLLVKVPREDSPGHPADEASQGDADEAWLKSSAGAKLDKTALICSLIPSALILVGYQSLVANSIISLSVASVLIYALIGFAQMPQTSAGHGFAWGAVAMAALTMLPALAIAYSVLTHWGPRPTTLNQLEQYKAGLMLVEQLMQPMYLRSAAMTFFVFLAFVHAGRSLAAKNLTFLGRLGIFFVCVNMLIFCVSKSGALSGHVAISYGAMALSFVLVGVLIATEGAYRTTIFESES